MAISPSLDLQYNDHRIFALIYPMKTFALCLLWSDEFWVHDQFLSMNIIWVFFDLLYAWSLNKMGSIPTWIDLVYIMSSFLLHYSVFHELNTLDACWIAVDVWSNRGRCRQESVYLSWTWCLYNDHHLRYRHDYSIFYQLANSNFFTHHALYS